MHAALLAFSLLRLTLRLEAGPEYDSNANHVETPRPGSDDLAPVASFLVRATAHGRLAYRSGDTSLRLALDLGGKLFAAHEAEAQDEVVARLDGELRREVGRHTLALAAGYRDSLQWNPCPPALVGSAFAQEGYCHRDFRVASLRALATLRDGERAFTAEAGVRGYEWKPFEDLSFLGVGGALSPSASWKSGGERQHEWTLSATGRIEWRGFAGAALRSASDLGDDPRAPRRSDLVASLALRAGWVGPVLVSAGWLLESDRSTSYGGSFLYQALDLEAVVPLPARFSLGGRAQLLFFRNGSLPASLTGEDEDRDAFMLDLARDFGHGLALRGRWQLFVAAPGSSTGGYQRQVATLALSWQPK